MTIPSLARSTPATRRFNSQSLNNQHSHSTEPVRKSLVMRKYQISSLKPDGSTHFSEQIGPATPAFEAAFSAFARGTLIKTVNGDVAIEDLQPGMKIVTCDHGPSTLMWVGSMTLVPNRDGISTTDAGLTRVTSNSLGMARPSLDFMAGPGARILTRPTELRENFGTDKVLTPLRNMVDGDNVIEITAPRPVTVYHLCLRRHATIFAAGLEAETFHPGPQFERDMGQNMLALFLSFFPHIRAPQDFGSLSHPRLPMTSEPDRKTA